MAGIHNSVVPPQDRRIHNSAAPPQDDETGRWREAIEQGELVEQGAGDTLDGGEEVGGDSGVDDPPPKLAREEMLETLERDGFLVFRGMVGKQELAVPLAAIDGDSADYVAMTAFIENTMLAKIGGELGWRPDYVKYRVSDGNNSVDASSFHRDIIAETGVKIPAYTCLTYMDHTTMELIPGSHRRLALSAPSLLPAYLSGTRVELHPGDVLVFDATLLHRGVFDEHFLSTLFSSSRPHRRLIQVFEVFPTPEDKERYAGQVVHVPGSLTKGHSALKNFSRVPGFSHLINLVGFTNAAGGYGTVSEDCRGAGVAYFSSEGGSGRTMLADVGSGGDWQAGSWKDRSGREWRKLNQYMVKEPTRVLEDQSCLAEHRWVAYNRQFAIFFVVFFAVVAAIVVGLIGMKRATRGMRSLQRRVRSGLRTTKL